MAAQAGKSVRGFQWRDVVDDVDPAPVSADHQIVVAWMDHDIVNGDRRNIVLELRPALARVGRIEDPEFRARKKKIHVTRSKNVPTNAPVKKVEATTSLDKLEVVISKLRKLEASKPRTVKTLSSTIAAVFQRTITDEEVASLVEALRLGDLISIADNKVTYSLPS